MRLLVKISHSIVAVGKFTDDKSVITLPRSESTLNFFNFPINAGMTSNLFSLRNKISKEGILCIEDGNEVSALLLRSNFVSDARLLQMLLSSGRFKLSSHDDRSNSFSSDSLHSG